MGNTEQTKPALFTMKTPQGNFESVASSFSGNEHLLAGFLNEAADALIQFEGFLEPGKLR